MTTRSASSNNTTVTVTAPEPPKAMEKPAEAVADKKIEKIEEAGTDAAAATTTEGPTAAESKTEEVKVANKVAPSAAPKLDEAKASDATVTAKPAAAEEKTDAAPVAESSTEISNSTEQPAESSGPATACNTDTANTVATEASDKTAKMECNDTEKVAEKVIEKVAQTAETKKRASDSDSPTPETKRQNTA